ncbi:hypothetical protein KKF34_09065 [Myxococcota bacterium]|nr:hypothetical protein [Myxococcota bacterium]MBU1380884.1 hypothetical protein [Myxococcota bacterium]MBU1497012.1 hypothetical protein [Myxococcota bacterium]
MKKITVLILLMVFVGCTSEKKETTTADKDKTADKEKMKKGSVPAAENSGDLCHGDACPGAVR